MLPPLSNKMTVNKSYQTRQTKDRQMLFVPLLLSFLLPDSNVHYAVVPYDIIQAVFRPPFRLTKIKHTIMA